MNKFRIMLLSPEARKKLFDLWTAAIFWGIPGCDKFEKCGDDVRCEAKRLYYVRICEQVSGDAGVSDCHALKNGKYSSCNPADDRGCLYPHIRQTSIARRKNHAGIAVGGLLFIGLLYYSGIPDELIYQAKALFQGDAISVIGSPDADKNDKRETTEENLAAPQQ